jgi:hypothetical protein
LRQIGQDWKIAQSAERNSDVTEFAVPSVNAIVRLRSSIAIRPFLFALARSSWEAARLKCIACFYPAHWENFLKSRQ